MVIVNDLERPMLSYYVIYYEKFKKVMQWTEKEALIILEITIKGQLQIIITFTRSCI